MVGTTDDGQKTDKLLAKKVAKFGKNKQNYPSSRKNSKKFNYCTSCACSANYRK